MLFIVFAFASCDPKSAVDSQEYISSSDEFEKSSRITRATLYSVPYEGKHSYWKESALKKTGKSVSVYGNDATNLWNDVGREELSYKINPVTPSPLNLALIFENDRSEKFQILLYQRVRKNAATYIFGNRIGDDDWWLEAKSISWERDFSITD